MTNVLFTTHLLIMLDRFLALKVGAVAVEVRLGPRGQVLGGRQERPPAVLSPQQREYGVADHPERLQKLIDIKLFT